ncbi:hypothetical protein F4825DRAFT_476461 [Nemania diffusa]|nr:hypothetical protein F4825DRAFT_476461 [Nemania diffusa]
MAAKVFSENDVTFIEYMGGTGFEERDHAFNEFLLRHGELTTGALISPRVYQLLFDEHLDPVIEARTYLVTELKDVGNQSGAQDTDAGKKAQLERFNDVGTKAKDNYEILLRKIMTVAVESSSHVYWMKHTKNNYKQSLGDWLQLKNVLLTSLISSSVNASIKSNLEAVNTAIVRGLETVSDALQTTTPAGKHIKTLLKSNPSLGDKRPLSNVDGGNGNSNNRNAGGGGSEPLPKKPRPQNPSSQWWGPNNSKLDCPDEFFDIIRASKAYLANPTEQPGTREHRYALTQFLRRALDTVGLRGHLNDLLLRDDWNFRDPNLEYARGPAFIQPGRPESTWRLGAHGFRGSNDFKRMLGGGLTAAELSTQNNLLADFQGMLALVHSMKEDKVSIRGGGSDDEGKREELRKGMGLLFRDPARLWKQLLEDTTFPGGIGLFRARVESLRPPMTDPDSLGTLTDKFKTTMSKIPLESEWSYIQEEPDVGALEANADEYLKAISYARHKAHKFIYDNPGYILPDQPKLHEPSGQDRPRLRYKGLRDSAFIKPIGYAFRARMYQVLRLSIYWRLYLSGVRTLAELIVEEKLLLEIWDEHEELYMEWENCRWFSLSNRVAIARLNNHYKSREFLRIIWGNERDAFDQALELLAQNPHHYDNLPKAKVTVPDAAPDPIPGASPSLDVLISEKILTGASGRQSPSSRYPAGVNPRWRLFDQSPERASENHGDADIEMDMGDEPEGFGNKNTNTGVKTRAVPDPHEANQTLEFLEKTRDLYQERLDQVIRQNDALDIHDPGNNAVISRNNLDIIAKQQVILSFNTEIHNFRRSVNPLAKGSYGRGALQRYQLPLEEDYMQYYREIPPKKKLPLGNKSLGLGPMPGEHPPADDPRVLFGAHPTFGQDPDPAEEEMDWQPAGNSLFDSKGEPVVGADRVSSVPVVGQPIASNAGAQTSYQADETPNYWADFVELHLKSWMATAPSGTASLSWHDWVESVYQVFVASTQDFRQRFTRDHRITGSNEDFKRLIEDYYRDRFGDESNHDNMPWRERERSRHEILKDLAFEVNVSLGQKGLPQDFREPGYLPTPPEDSAEPATSNMASNLGSGASGKNTAGNGVLNKLSELIKKRNDADLEVHQLHRKRRSGKLLNPQQHSALERARKLRRDYSRLYNMAKAGADVGIRAQVDLLEQEERIAQKARRDEADQATDTGKEKLHEYQAEAAERRKAQFQSTQKEKEKTPESSLPKAANTVDELALAQKLCHEATEHYKEAQARLEASQVEAEKAQAAYERSTNDPYLKKLLQWARKDFAQREAERADALADVRAGNEALQAQKGWSHPAESPEDLAKRYRTLAGDFHAWADNYDWDAWPLTAWNAQEQWTLDATALMHEAYKALGINAGARYWFDMRASFWAEAVGGATLERKRRVWLHSVMEDLNGRIAQLGGVPFVTDLAPPPDGWAMERRSRKALLVEGEKALKKTPPPPPTTTTTTTTVTEPTATKPTAEPLITKSGFGGNFGGAVASPKPFLPPPSASSPNVPKFERPPVQQYQPPPQQQRQQPQQPQPQPQPQPQVQPQVQPLTPLPPNLPFPENFGFTGARRRAEAREAARAAEAAKAAQNVPAMPKVPITPIKPITPSVPVAATTPKPPVQQPVPKQPTTPALPPPRTPQVPKTPAATTTTTPATTTPTTLGRTPIRRPPFQAPVAATSITPATTGFGRTPVSRPPFQTPAVAATPTTPATTTAGRAPVAQPPPPQTPSAAPTSTTRAPPAGRTPVAPSAAPPPPPSPAPAPAPAPLGRTPVVPPPAPAPAPAATTPTTAATTTTAAAAATPAPAVKKRNKNEKNDAWPELKTLTQATWGTIIAHEALGQKPGVRAPLPDDVRLHPRGPSPVKVGDDFTGYYDL